MKVISKYFGILLFFPLAASGVSQQLTFQTIHSHAHNIVAERGLKPIAKLDTSSTMRLAVALPLRNQSYLDNLLRQIYNPTSPLYHKYLSVDQFTSEFGPSAQDYDSVEMFLRSSGLKVVDTSNNRMVLDVEGSVGNINRALHVTMLSYRHPTENRTFYAPDQDPSVSLSIPILAIGGLSNYSLPHPDSKTIPIPTGQEVSPEGGSGPGGYWGYDFRNAYAPGVSLTGSGQTVGLLQFDGFTPNDITAYEKETGLPSVAIQVVKLDGFNGVPEYPQYPNGQTEVTLDIENTISMAPGLSKVIVYEAGEQGNWIDLLNRMTTDDLAKELSCSWGSSLGANSAAEQDFEEMAAQGQSFFAASGDNDAYTGLIGFPDDSPNITIVGGTTLTTTGAGGSYVSETTWNSGGGKGSGGGISTQYSIPTWQQGVSMTNNQGSTTMRNIPDVALVGQNVDVYVRGSNQSEQGTSCAAPLWAGFTALANEQSAHNGQNPIGFLNPLIYAIGQSELYSSDFHDTPAGSNNAWPGSSGQYAATSGFDLATGWGTPDGQHLINDLASTIWSGDTAFSSNFTVSSGQTVAIMPGANITFSNGAGIIVHGTLNVYGTSSQPVTMTSSSGTWAGITFAGSSTGNLQDCTISSASSPVIIDTANVTINGCTINNSSFQSNFYGGTAIEVLDADPNITNTAIDGESNSFNGITFTNGSIGTVSGCTIQNLGAGTGAVIEGGSSPSILSSRITGNGYYGIIVQNNGSGNPVIESDYINSNGGGTNYAAIIFDNASGHVNFDTLSNNYDGIHCYDYGSPYTSGPAGGQNIVIDNSYGIYADTHSSPVFGHAVGNPPVTYDGTCNQFYSNSSDNLYAVNNSSITAEYDWWGSYPPDGGFYADGTSSLDYTNALTSPGACPSSGSATVAANSTTNTAATPIQTGLWDEAAGQWKQAATEYVRVLRDTLSLAEKRYALERLYHVLQVSKDTTIIGTFKALGDSTGPLTSMAQEILAGAYVAAGRLSDAETTANSLIAQHPGTGTAERALILLASLYQYNPSYNQVSSSALAELEKKWPSALDPGLISALNTGMGSASPTSPTSQNRPVGVTNDSIDSAPLKFELGNYPNPFNPTTVIKYEVPKETHVTITIYDVLGRKVETLVDGIETAGIHEVTYDGSRLASGVYFYRLTTPTYSKVMKMLTLK